MRIIVDENIPLYSVSVLREMGHIVTDLRGTSSQGSSDDLIFSKAQSESSLIITTDKGFLRHRNDHHYGILIIRLRKPNTRLIHDRIIQALRATPESKWHGRVLVMRDRSKAVIRSKHDPLG